MFGKRSLSMLAFCLLSACGNQKYQDEVTRRRLIAWIDDRQFQRVVSFLEFEATAEERVRFRAVEAQAEMGLGGFEVLSVFEDVKAELGFRREAFKAMSNNCPTHAVKTKELKRLPNRCLIVRFFNSLPEPDQPHLLRARDLWRSEVAEKQKGISDQDRLLAATFEAALIVARAGKVLADYYQISIDPLKATDVDGLFADIHTAAEDTHAWLEYSMNSARKLNRRFMGIEQSSIFDSKISSRVEFAQSTGIPKLLSIADMNHVDVEDRVLRANVIRELDSLLVNYFKVAL